MKTPKISLLACACIFFANQASAKLPSLNEAPWFGIFAGHEDRNVRFHFSDTALTEIRPMDGKEPIGMAFIHRLDFYVRVTQPDGQVIDRQLTPESLTSESQPMTKIQKFTVRGKTPQGVEVELWVDHQRNSFRFGGKLLNPAQQGPNQVEFGIRTRLQKFYQFIDNPDAPKHLANIRNDEIRLRFADGGREKLPLGEPIKDLEALKAKDIRQIEFNVFGYRGKRVEYATSEHSRIRILKADDKPLHEGFNLLWTADPAKNLENTEWLEITVR